MKYNGISSCKAAKKPKLTPMHKANRLKLAKSFAKMEYNFWNKVIFSDESTFRLCGTSGSQLVWRKKGERYLEKNIISTEKFGGGGIMVWGFITINGPGDLVFINGTMN